MVRFVCFLTIVGQGSFCRGSVPLCQAHTVTEFGGVEFGASPEADEPSPVLLKHTFAGVTERIAESIQSALSGIRLPTAIIERHAVLIHNGDEIAVQTDQTLTGLSIEVNRGVVLAPVAVALDCFGHLLFDLTHGRLNSFDSFTIDDFGTCAKNV